MTREVEVALEAARAAVAIIRSRSPEKVDHKGSVDLVTEVDLACERAIRAVLSRHMPDVPVLGEEEGGAIEADTRWVVDPIDGTTNFAHGHPFFCVSIALYDGAQGLVGLVHAPALDTTWKAAWRSPSSAPFGSGPVHSPMATAKVSAAQAPT